MKNFLILTSIFFALLIVAPVTGAWAQCPVQASVVTKTHTDITCFGAANGTITVDLADASTSEPYNFELIDLTIPAIVTLSVTETENKPNRSVVYSNVPAGSYAVAFFKTGCPTLQITEGAFGFVVLEPAAIGITTNNIDPDCDPTIGVGNGQIDLTVTGGTAPYGITWAGPTAIPNGTQVTAANLDAGTYTISITDANSCTFNQNIAVAVSTQADAGPPTALVCGANTLNLSANAAGAGEIGTWSGPVGVNFSNINDPNATVTNLNVGANILTWTIQDIGFLCPGNSDNITVTYSNVLISGSANVVLDCFGDSDGAGTFTVTGGSANFTYTVVSNTAGATIVIPPAGPTTSVSFTAASVGVVTLRVQDASGCTSQATITITQPTVVTFGTTQNNVTCFGGTNGSITVTAAGGTGPYEFSSNNGGSFTAGANPFTFSALAAGGYNIVVRDANLCTSTATLVTITQPAAAVTFGTTQNNVTCFGGTNGSITVTAAGGTGPYEFSSNNGGSFTAGANPFTFSALAAGGYNIVVRDANLCTSTATLVTITQPAAAVAITSTSKTDATCLGVNNGSIQVNSVVGGTPGYQYSIDNGVTFQVSNTFTNLAPATYDVVARDANSCVSVSVQVIVGSGVSFAPSASFTNASCSGVDDGTIQVNSVSGGTSPYTYSIDNGVNFQVSNSFVGLAPGSYDVVARDNNGCLSSVQVVTIGTGLSFDPQATPTAASCSGVSDGSILVTGTTGGTGPFEYSNDSGVTFQISNTFSGLATGSYDIVVRDANTCISTTLVVNVGTGLSFDPQATPTAASCSGVNDGSILVTGTTGGTGPFEFSNDGGVTFQLSNTFAGLATGSYDIVVRDANTCISTTLVVNVGTGLSFDPQATPTPASCTGVNDGSILVTGTTGGTGPFEFSNDGGLTFQISNTFLGLATGDYDIVVRDANACLSTTLVVNVGSGLSFDPQATPTAASCSGVSDGSILVSGTTGGTGPFEFSNDGGLTFQISNTFAGLASGSYDIVVRDANTCISTTLPVTVGTVLSITTSVSKTDATCLGNDGSITVNSVTGGTGPYQYSINNGTTFQLSNVFNPVSVGNYNVLVEDANGCRSVATPITISLPGGCGGANCFAFTILVDPAQTNRPSCGDQNDGQITLTISGSVVGPYILQLLKPTDPGFTAITQVVPAGTYSFPGLSPGNYEYRIQDQAGNTCTQPYSLPVQTTIEADAAGFVDAACFGQATGEATITVSSGGNSPYVYSLDNGVNWIPFTSPFTITDLPPNGTYSILVADDAADQCPDEVTVTIGNGSPQIDIGLSATSATCGNNDGSIIVSTPPSGGTGGAYTFKIDGIIVVPVANSFSNIAGGNRVVTVVDNSGCEQDFAIFVPYPDAIEIGGIGSSDASCVSQGNISIIINNYLPAVQYEVGISNSLLDEPTVYVDQYYTGNGLVIITPLARGSYFVWLRTGAGQCPTIVNTIVGNNPITLAGPYAVDFDFTCRGNDGSLTLINILGDSVNQYNYQFEILQNGFSFTGSITYGESLFPFTTPSLNAPLDPEQPYKIKLSQDQTATSGCVVATAFVDAPLGALDTLSVTTVVSLPDAPTGSVQINIQESYEEPYAVWLVSNSISTDTLLAVQSPVLYSVAFNTLEAGLYSIYLEDAHGCRKEYEFVLPFDNRIFIPNIFTPNNDPDRLNEVFYIRNLPASGSKLSITNRWGKEVFSSGNYNPDNLWDGGGSPDGVYFYRLQVSGGKVYTGWVEILRGTKP